VCVAWIFFRANSVGQAWYILSHLTQGLAMKILHHQDKAYQFDLRLGRSNFIVSVLAIMTMECLHLIQRHRGIRHMLAEKPIWLRWTVYYVLIFGILLFGVFDQHSFIYFQF